MHVCLWSRLFFVPGTASSYTPCRGAGTRRAGQSRHAMSVEILGTRAILRIDIGLYKDHSEGPTRALIKELMSFELTRDVDGSCRSSELCFVPLTLKACHLGLASSPS